MDQLDWYNVSLELLHADVNVSVTNNKHHSHPNLNELQYTLRGIESDIFFIVL